MILWATLPLAKTQYRIWGYAGVLIICVFAFTYTTPWDNYLVASGIWDYGEERVLGRWGHVPIEEYIFFILQPLMTGAWLLTLLRSRELSIVPEKLEGRDRFIRWGGTILLLIFTVLGILMITVEKSRYMGLIVAWASPPLAIQWAYGGHRLWAWRGVLAMAIWPPTVYLWFMDWFAIRRGIWRIAEETSLGDFFGLPYEEAFFFFVTNCLIVGGVVLWFDLRRRPFGEKLVAGISARFPRGQKTVPDAGATNSQPPSP